MRVLAQRAFRALTVILTKAELASGRKDLDSSAQAKPVPVSEIAQRSFAVISVDADARSQKAVHGWRFARSRPQNPHLPARDAAGFVTR